MGRCSGLSTKKARFRPARESLRLPPVSDTEKSRVQNLTVAGDEAGLRLDRWFRRRFPELGHGRLEKLLRTGQVRVDGRRAKSGLRLGPGQTIRVPPLGLGEGRAPGGKAPPRIDPNRSRDPRMDRTTWTTETRKPSASATSAS